MPGGRLPPSGRAAGLRDRPANLLRVKSLHLGREVLRYIGSLNLQRRRDVVVVGGEVDRQHAELADRFSPGNGLVGVVDRRLQVGEQVGIGGQIGGGGGG